MSINLGGVHLSLNYSTLLDRPVLNIGCSQRYLGFDVSEMLCYSTIIVLLKLIKSIKCVKGEWGTHGPFHNCQS